MYHSIARVKFEVTNAVYMMTLHSRVTYVAILLSALVWRAARIHISDTCLSKVNCSSTNTPKYFTQHVGFIVCPDMFKSISFTSFAFLTTKVWKFYWAYFHLVVIKPGQHNTSCHFSVPFKFKYIFGEIPDGIIDSIFVNGDIVT